MKSVRFGRGVQGVCVAAALLSPSVAAAESNAERADALNEEGKALMKDKRYEEATDRFLQAVNLSPEGRLYFNLCAAFYQQGLFYDAVQACEAVPGNGADAALTDKAAKLLGAVKAEADRQGIDLTPPPVDPGDPIDPGDPTDPGDPSNPGDPTKPPPDR
ncbi:MAG: hypothetical protein R2939_14305, partial [Kofleriaceae bacterium]